MSAHTNHHNKNGALCNKESVSTRTSSVSEDSDEHDPSSRGSNSYCSIAVAV
jgi:hypothetical protein